VRQERQSQKARQRGQADSRGGIDAPRFDAALLDERKLPAQDEVFGRSSQPRPQEERCQRDDVGSQSQNQLDKDDHGFMMPYTVRLASSRAIE